MSGPTPYSRGSRSHGSRSHPCSHFVRFTEEENKKLVGLCRKRGLTVQAFGHAAMMRALNEANLGKKTDGESARDDEESRSRRSERELPRGLGIRDRLQQASDERRTRVDENETPAPSIPSPSVQPALLRARSGDEVLTLARAIVEAPKSARQDVMQAACRALAPHARTEQEAAWLADQLTAEVKRLDSAAPKTALERVRTRMGR